MQFIFSSLHQILNDDDETLRLRRRDARMDCGPFKSLKFGAKFTDHDRDLVFNATTYGGFHVPINTTPGTDFFAGPMTPATSWTGSPRPARSTQYWQIDRGAIDGPPVRRTSPAPSASSYPQQSFSASARTRMPATSWATSTAGKWHGNVGVRYVRTEQTSRGQLVRPSGAIANPFGNYDAGLGRPRLTTTCCRA